MTNGYFKQVENNVVKLLQEHPTCAKNDMRKRAIWKYWQMFDGVEETIDYFKFVQLTSPETITRAIRKIIEAQPKDEAEKIADAFQGKIID